MARVCLACVHACACVTAWVRCPAARRVDPVLPCGVTQGCGDGFVWPGRRLCGRRCFFLHRPRLELYDRIAQRVEEMAVGGLLREAASLLAVGLAPGANMASKAIGYRQAMEWLQVCGGRGRPRQEAAAARMRRAPVGARGSSVCAGARAP